MKVYRERLKWTGHTPVLHAVERREWKDDETRQHLMYLHIETFCGLKYRHSKGDTYEEYAQDIHRKKLCEECVKVIQLKIRQKRELAARSLKTESQQ